MGGGAAGGGSAGGGGGATTAVGCAGAALPAYLKASNTSAYDKFGWELALSADGNTLAVAAFYEDSSAVGVDGNQLDDSALESGAVYVFACTGNSWAQQAYVKASNTGAEDAFGLGVALSGDGNTLAVGAAGEDSNATGIGGDQADNSATNSGAVYVFTRTGTTWVQQAFIKASNAETYDVFGTAIALSADGNTLAVSAVGEDSNASGVGGGEANNTVSGSGAVYVFTRASGAWSQRAYVKSSSPRHGDGFGGSLALNASGQLLAVGAQHEDGPNDAIPESGAVFVFALTGASWAQEAYLKASNAGVGDYFGFWLALSADGTTLAVTAPDERSNATGINGNQADDSSIETGAVYVFSRVGSSWTQQAYVKASNAEAKDGLGYSVSLSADGDTMAVGAVHEDSNATGIDGPQTDNSAYGSGAVYEFARSGSTWTQRAYIKATNTTGADFFGSWVNLSADGSVLAIGGWGEDSGATGVGGDQGNDSVIDSGAVYVFRR